MACVICPRHCNIDRMTQPGFCHALEHPLVAKTMLHHWEEPPISGTRGSGAVFFAGCNLRCVFCQNHTISQNAVGKAVSIPQLADLFWELESRGVHNINLVTPMHFVSPLAKALETAKNRGLRIPVVYNTNAYETVASLRRLEGLIDIYLPDLKYFDDTHARQYSHAPNYFAHASQAVLEMQRQVGDAVIDAQGIMQKGLLIRHLLLPGLRQDSMRILDWIRAYLPTTYLSLMAQYVPVHEAKNYPNINRRITTFEYDSIVAYFFKIGLQNGFMQSREAATSDFTPDFL